MVYRSILLSVYWDWLRVWDFRAWVVYLGTLKPKVAWPAAQTIFYDHYTVSQIMSTGKGVGLL